MEKWSNGVLEPSHFGLRNADFGFFVFRHLYFLLRGDITFAIMLYNQAN